MATRTSLNVIFTVALPVRIAQLGAHWEAYRETLPVLNTLRACNRFGKGSQCYINNLPVELIERISHYYVLPIRQEKLAWWKSLQDCYEDNCDLTAHWSKEEILSIYQEHRAAGTCKCVEHASVDDLDDLADFIGKHVDWDQTHNERLYEWQDQIEKHLPKAFRTFNKHFGLDIWLSKICLGLEEDGDSYRHTAVAYVILPNRAESVTKWPRPIKSLNHYDDYYNFESGWSSTVAPFQAVTSNVVQRFKRVMKALDVDLFVEWCRTEQGALSLAPKDQEHAPIEESEASYPRAMLLIRNKVETE